MADADGAVWGFGCLNAIGAWNHPTVKAMRDAGSVEDDLFDLFGWPECELKDVEGELQEYAYSFLYSRECAGISLPVRVPVAYEVHRGSMLRHALCFVRCLLLLLLSLLHAHFSRGLLLPSCLAGAAQQSSDSDSD